MSDRNRSQLAAAKKRLKQFQAQSQAPAAAAAAQSDTTSIASSNQSTTVPHQESEPEPEAPPTPLLPALAPAENGSSSSSLLFNGQPDKQAEPAASPAAAHLAELAALQQAASAAHDSARDERQRNAQLLAEIQQLQLQVQQLSSAPATAAPAAPAAATPPPAAPELANAQQTIALLVNEKSALASSLQKFQLLSREKIAEIEELQGRLNASRFRVNQLERELAGAREVGQRLDERQQRLCEELERSAEQLRAGAQRETELCDERAELRQQLEVRRAECENGRRELGGLNARLEMQQLRIAQLSADDEAAAAGAEAATAEPVSAAAAAAVDSDQQQQRVEELQAALERLLAENNQTGAEYQAYVQQLSGDNKQLAQQLQQLAEECERLRDREQSLVRHLGELERQMQQQRAQQGRWQQAMAAGTVAEASADLPNGDGGPEPEAKVASAVAVAGCGACEELKLTNAAQATELGDQLAQLAQLRATITSLEDSLERLQADQPDARSLHETMHSDKVTASRAVAQNVQLKQQLEELQQAFVQLSNDKLELTERLQSEQHLGRGNRLSAEQRLEQVTSIEQKLHFKDEEMIRLSHENEQRSKELLQLQQEVDRLRHYEMRVQAAGIVQQQATASIQRLQRRIAQLEEGKTSGGADTAEEATPPVGTDGGAEQQQQQPMLPESTGEAVDSAATDGDDQTLLPLLETPHIATEEAMLRLQERFTRTMSDIAELSEEKNRLEHLCMQLQGETETIGEYIALYQCQRQQLKQRELERDVQMQQIIDDREEMRLKLVQLNGLIEQLIPGQQQQQPELERRLSAISLPADSALTNGGTTEVEAPTGAVARRPETTAKQILHLLGEIQVKNQDKVLYSQQSMADVHRCACCSGKLETV